MIRELAAGRPFVCPVSPGATCWWMSRPCAAWNILHAGELEESQLARRRSFQLPALHCRVEEIVTAVGRVYGVDAAKLVTYRPVDDVEARFGSLPPIRVPQAEAAGFRHDGTPDALVRRALALSADGMHLSRKDRETRMRPRIRRIVTGHAPDGRSVATSDGPVPVVLENYAGNAGLYFSEIWRTAGGQPAVGNGPDPAMSGDEFRLATAGAGTTFRVVDFPPGGFVSPMHRTESVDYGIVLSGDKHLILTDSEYALQPGDIVIQRGTDHVWANRAHHPARMAFILVAGEFSEEIRPFVDIVTP